MAQTRKSAPSIIDVVKQLKQGKILPVYYLFGEDTFSLNFGAKSIEDAVSVFISSDFDRDICYGDERSIQDVISMARAFPFGSEKKLIVLKDAEKTKDKKFLESYISSPPEFSVLVLIHNGTITNLSSSPFDQLLKKDFLYEAKELKGDYLISWVVELTKSKGKNISYDNAAFLADVSGGDRIIIENQLEKIISFLGDKDEITFKDIKEMAASFKEYSIFDLQNAVFQKDKSSSLQIALSMLDKGEDAIFIISMLTKSFI
ncbi:MAG: DNA polymerase III subunit delta, partial [Ignavibacteriaceae bacterium]|nr:DNA polymerase III subunit delta [Ignavibacteriaceae bacterium]